MTSELTENDSLQQPSPLEDVPSFYSDTAQPSDRQQGARNQRIELVQGKDGGFYRPDCPNEPRCRFDYWDGKPAIHTDEWNGIITLRGKVSPHVHLCSEHANAAQHEATAAPALMRDAARNVIGRYWRNVLNVNDINALDSALAAEPPG